MSVRRGVICSWISLLRSVGGGKSEVRDPCGRLPNDRHMKTLQVSLPRSFSVVWVASCPVERMPVAATKRGGEVEPC
jgi:hypothetical protein